MEPGQLALIPVTFVEDRGGRALVRLPNGSKTSIDYEALDIRPSLARFIRSADGAGVTFMCLLCCVTREVSGWHQAVAVAEDHHSAEHGDVAGN